MEEIEEYDLSEQNVEDSKQKVNMKKSKEVGKGFHQKTGSNLQQGFKILNPKSQNKTVNEVLESLRG